MFNNAVFQGAGVRSMACVGALAKLEEHHFKFKAVAGVSGGSIVAALYAAGYTATEMQELLQKDFSEFLYLTDKKPNPNLISPHKLESINLLKIIKILIEITWHKPSFWSKNGIYITDKIYHWMYALLEQKGVKTFNDLKEKDVKLTIIGAGIKDKQHKIFNQQNYPTMKIAQAVCCSISIPFFFEPVTLGMEKVVDGGILNTFPLSIFSEETEETIGFKFEPEKPRQNNNLHPTVEYLLDLTSAMWLAHDKLIEFQLNFSNNISINTEGISSIKFSLEDSEKILLFDRGYEAAQKFYKENQLNDYQQLADCLREKKWLEANQETFNLMLNFCGKEKERWFDPEDIKNLECNRLNRIDDLWKKYSNNHLGFTPQKKIWDDVGRPPGNINFFNPYEADLTAKKWLEFGKKNGWFKPKFSLDLRKFLISFAPKDPQTMRNNITQANSIQDIPSGSLPNSILFWYELGIDEQLKSINKQSLLLLATLYCRLEECQEI